MSIGTVDNYLFHVIVLHIFSVGKFHSFFTNYLPHMFVFTHHLSVILSLQPFTRERVILVIHHHKCISSFIITNYFSKNVILLFVKKEFCVIDKAWQLIKLRKLLKVMNVHLKVSGEQMKLVEFIERRFILNKNPLNMAFIYTSVFLRG